MEELPSHKEHTLVFLPGQKDIEQCVRAFASHPAKQSNWEAMPLFGSLPPEQQQQVIGYNDNPTNNGKRMVCFTTNVAETSLTVPGIRLVVDTGVENQVLFDAKRRLNVLELRRISQSSANQRKGRAGRICEGHCVRLFPLSECEPNSIPEIKRASLDLVCLRICSLKDQSPKTFPFIERPNNEILQASMSLLKDLACIDPASERITPK
eukprot:PhF_6_TR7964/c0_g1_i1/m.12094